MPEARYAAFISYSSKDGAFAARLHKALESYGIPTSLGKFQLSRVGKKNRVYPVFRDREEAPAGDLATRIRAALEESASLIVICSPNSARSPWVQKEIEQFIALGRRDRIFAVIAEDAPLVREDATDATLDSFPPSFRGNALSDPNALEPLAADARPGKDGFRKAWLKIVAGILGVSPGQLMDRDRRRRIRQRMVVGTSVAAGACIVLVAALTAAEVRRRYEALQLAQDSYSINQDPAAAVALAIDALPPRGALLNIDTANARAFVERHGGWNRLSVSDFPKADVSGPVVLRFTSDGEHVVTADPTGRVCALASTLRVEKCTTLPAPLRNLVILDEGRIAVSAQNGTLTFLSMPGLDVISTLSLSRTSIDGFAFAGQTIAAADADGKIYILDAGTMTTRSEQIAQGWIRAVALTLDGTRIGLGDLDGRLEIRDVQSWQLLYEASLETPANDMSFDGDELVVAFEDGTVRAFRQGAEPRQVIGVGAPIRSLQMLLPPRKLIAGSSDGMVAVIEGSKTLSFATERIDVATAALSPDGANFVFGTLGGVVEKWAVIPGAATSELLCESAAMSPSSACQRRGLLELAN